MRAAPLCRFTVGAHDEAWGAREGHGNSVVQSAKQEVLEGLVHRSQRSTSRALTSVTGMKALTA